MEAIETFHHDRLVEHVERLAQHALRGEVWTKAVAYLRQAATKAWARFANREAGSYLEQALGVLPHLPPSPETHELAVDLQLDLQVPLNGLGEIERLLDYLREAELLAEALGDLPRMGRIAAQAATSAEQALAIARRVGDLALEAQANLRVGQACSHLGEYSRALAALKRNVDVLVGNLQTERFGLPSLPAVLSRAFMSWRLASLGEFSAATAVAEDAVRIAEAEDDRRGLALAQARLGWIHVRQGDTERALPWLERGLDNARRGAFEIGILSAAGPLGEAQAACDATAEALALLEQAAEQAASVRFVAVLPGILGALGAAYLLAGRLAEARHTADRMLQMARTSRERHSHGDALLILAEVRARTTPAEFSQAVEAYREALAIAEQIRARPLAAHCHLGLGTLYRRTDKREQAQEHLATATTMYREMGMTYWLDQVAKQLEALA